MRETEVQIGNSGLSDAEDAKALSVDDKASPRSRSGSCLCPEGTTRFHPSTDF
jgi:hypothetical protein